MSEHFKKIGDTGQLDSSFREEDHPSNGAYRMGEWGKKDSVYALKRELKKGEILVGIRPSNKGLRIELLANWDPEVQNSPQDRFTVLEGGTGRKDRGKVYERMKEMTFDNEAEFLKEARKADPSIRNPLKANMLYLWSLPE